MPEDIDEAIDSLTDAIYSEKISIERLNKSRERRKKQIDNISNTDEFKNEELNNKFLFEASQFSKSIIKKTISARATSIEKVNSNDINLIKIDNFDLVSNKLTPALNLPESLGFKNLIVHPFSISSLQNKNKKFLELEQIGNGKILIQLFVRGKPFIGLDYQNHYWVEAIKNLEMEERLLGIIVYGCPYLFDKINRSINYSIPLAYSPSQSEEAQNQILRCILNSQISHEKIEKKSIQLFTD
tara:strand:- start:432 stop:1157 length:726 start_codon:yes stop_codon:yes gene_type:complete